MESFNFLDQRGRFKQTAGSEVIKLRNVIMEILQHGMTISEDKHFNSFKHGGNYNCHIVPCGGNYNCHIVPYGGKYNCHNAIWW